MSVSSVQELHPPVTQANPHLHWSNRLPNTDMTLCEERPWDELRERLQGRLLVLTKHDFFAQFKVFNSASRSSEASTQTPEAVLFPLCAQDVSAGVQFASSQSLSLSVKSGGYNPSHWSSAGQLVIDLSDLNGMELDLPGDSADKTVVHHDSLHTKRSSSSSSQSGAESESSIQSTGTNSSLQSSTSSNHNNNNNNIKKTKRKAESPPLILHHSNSDHSSRSNSNVSESSNSGSGFSSRGRGRGSANSDCTSPSSVVSPETDKGKRRMLDGYDRNNKMDGHEDQHELEHETEVAMIIGNAPEPHPDGLPCVETATNAKPNQQDPTENLTEGSRDSDRTMMKIEIDDEEIDAINFVLANSYPPTNLACVDPPRAKEFVQELRHKLNTRQITFESIREAGIQPFNYDVTTKQLRLSDIPRPRTINLSLANSPKSASELTKEGYMHNSATYPNSRTTGRQGFPVPPPSPPTRNVNESNYFTFSSSSLPLSQHSTATRLEDDQSFGVQNRDHFVTVTFGSGVQAKDLFNYTYQYGYLVPQACYPVGTAIFTTGGYGFVSRLFGLSMDLTTEMEIVLPTDGRIVTLRSNWLDDPLLSATEKKEQEELWWAFRGAGTAFGIVTRIRAKAFKVGKVLAGNLIFPFNPITTPSLVKHWRDCLKKAPRELYTALTLTAGPSPSSHVVVIQFSWCGKQQAEGEALLQSILSWDGERCLLKDVEVRPYLHQQENISQILKSRDDTRWLVRSTLVHSLSDDSIHKTVQQFQKVPAGSSWLIEIAGGAIGEPPFPSCYPVEHRMAPFQIAALHQWIDPIDDERQKSVAEHWIYDTLDSEACGPYPCFLASGEGRSRMIKVYGQKNWDRLSALKKKYDSKGLLRFTHFEDELLK